MGPYLDEPRVTSSDEARNLELRDRSSLEGEQAQRLLDDGSDDDVLDDLLDEVLEEELSRPKRRPQKWFHRPVWVVLASILIAALIFWGIFLLIQNFFVGGEGEEDFDHSLNVDFRLPESAYILDQNWDFMAAPKTRKYKWSIIDRIASPDGVQRTMITVNGQFPGPMIECNEGDTIVIDIDNQSVNATSLHFHGLFQNGTNWMDGSPGITQCPIAPGGKYRYKFTIKDQSGTYFWHGHQAVQISDGLYGPLIIHSRDERELQKIPYTTDRVLMIQDYWYDLSSGVLKTSLEPGNEGIPIPDAALLNGDNLRDCSTILDRPCDNTTARFPYIELAPNENHRFRFINVGASSWFEISLDQHPLAITEVDGTNIVPSNTNQIQIAPAQRYSTVFTANQTGGGSFLLNARMITHCFTNPSLPGGGLDTVRGLVQYSQPPDDEGVSQSSPTEWNVGFALECRDMNNTQFKPLPEVAAPAVPDYTYYIRNNIEIGNWRLERGFFNTSTWRPDLKSPSLHRTVDGLRSRNESFTTTVDGVNEDAFHLNTEFVIQHTGVKVVDLIIQNFDENNHPLHLHGHKFWVLAQGHAYFPGYENMDIDLSNPIRRDTAGLEGFGWMLIRFVTDNPGMWAFHCHTAWHSESGLLMQFLSQPEVMATWMIPEANRRLCEADGLEKGATPKDEIWFGFGTSGD